jgi:hypothetical protein
MLVYFTDSVTKNKIAINPTYVVGVFIANAEEHKGKTVLSLLNGSFLIDESQIDVVGILQGQIK